MILHGYPCGKVGRRRINIKRPAQIERAFRVNMNEKESVSPIRVDRPLTDEERSLIRWILKHGEPEAAGFLEQLDRARVIGLCPCGCASIDFTIDGLPTPPPGVHVLGDFIHGDESNLAGVFVFEAGGILKGLEVYGLAVEHPRELPKSSELRPMDP